ncbi:cupin domain-containing protein [Nitrosomonas marina]|uniref:Cupin domain-containing protein n=1 Tax=Nitrosomonas marina TaxID=917 RepID=A0A1H8G3D6_9PROT|nr:cupin domain-containing protein [Nitrosomonas marina]SEN38290.1 Cupin domain-containing protein [Nitrosomonas marina]
MKNIVTTMKNHSHPNMPNVNIYAWSNVASGNPQEVIVKVAPNTIVPLHAHSVDAQMVIIDGSAEVLYDQKQLYEANLNLNKKNVKAGDIVYFKAKLAHGFRAFENGLTFLSINGGIVDKNTLKWDLTDG